MVIQKHTEMKLTNKDGDSLAFLENKTKGETEIVAEIIGKGHGPGETLDKIVRIVFSTSELLDLLKELAAN